MRSTAVSLLLLVIWLLLGLSLRTLGQVRRAEPPPPEFALEITLPGSAVRPPLLEIRRDGESGTLLLRRFLTIANPQAAGDLTGLQVSAAEQDGAIAVRLSVLFNDLSKPEWWKEKKEKPVGEYLVREGQPVRPLELVDFGIAPIELGLSKFNNRVFKPGEGPLVINTTTSLQVAKLEKIGTHYQLTLKNTSDKRIIWYMVRSASAGVGSAAPVASRGAIPDEELVVRYLPAESVESGGLRISSVVFDDGTFEGDPVEAAKVFAEQDGFKIQSSSVLERIQATLRAEDGDLVPEVLKLETGLWTIPEAVDKASALELLKAKYPYYDEKVVSILYESLKGGLYNARNHALRQLGDLKRSIGEEDGESSGAKSQSRAQLARVVLTRLKGDFEEVIARAR
jgi:hypothetical protein